MSYTPWTTRTIGIEMEMTSRRASDGANIALGDLARALSAGLEGVDGARPVNNAGGYTHSAGRSWDVKTDASCGYEVASPAFTLDAEGESAELKAGCEALARFRPVIDRRCGLHVWVNCSDYSWEDMQRLLALWSRYEPVFFEMVPASRRENTYCRPMRKSTWTAPEGGHIRAVRRALAATSQATMGQSGFEKYSALNVSRWWTNGMVEFRLHSGTVDYVKIRNWVKVLCALVNRIKHPTMPTVRASLGRTDAMDAEMVNGGFSTLFFAKTLGLVASAKCPDVPASNAALVAWIESRRARFNPQHRTPTRGTCGRRRVATATTAVEPAEA